VNLLKSFGCEYAQGYFFSRPLDSDKMVRTLVAAEANCYVLPQESQSQVVSPAR
jgi:sensor c-di-GMP phosphodiesterase-like protein